MPFFFFEDYGGVQRCTYWDIMTNMVGNFMQKMFFSSVIAKDYNHIHYIMTMMTGCHNFCLVLREYKLLEMLFCIFNGPNHGTSWPWEERGDLMIVNRMEDDSWLRCHTPNRCDWTGVRRLHVALIDWSPIHCNGCKTEEYNTSTCSTGHWALGLPLKFPSTES